MEKRVVLRKGVKRTAGSEVFNCAFVFRLLYWPHHSASSSVVLRSQQLLYFFISCVCFQGVQVDERLFLMTCLKTYRICVAEIHKGLALL